MEVKEAKEVEEVKEAKDRREGTRCAGEQGGFCERNMVKDSTGMDYCQGTVLHACMIRIETGKWNGWKELAGKWEFGETVRGWIIRGTSRLTRGFPVSRAFLI